MNLRNPHGLIWFKTGVLLFVFLHGIPAAFGQDQDLNVLARKKYVQRFTDYYFIWPVVKYRSTDLVLQSLQDKRQKLTFRPNVAYHAGVGVYMFGVGVQVLLAVPTSRASVRTFGSSDRDLPALLPFRAKTGGDERGTIATLLREGLS